MPQFDNFAILLAGGSGTRLWPLSRTLMPKQLLSLTGRRTLLQQTAERICKSVPPDNIFTVTQEKHRFEVLGQLLEVDKRLTANVLIEPLARNTLPAIAWAVARIRSFCPKAVISVFPSDHVIQAERRFLSIWAQAGSLAASSGKIVLFGIHPVSPATGYGYIQVQLQDRPRQRQKTTRQKKGGMAYPVRRFVEKPDIKRAQRYVKSGDYYWNSGMFVFEAGVFWDSLGKVCPQVRDLAACLAKSSANDAGTDVYARFPDLSIDYGLLEKVKDIFMIPANIGWSDLGSWESIHQFLGKDGKKNASHGIVIHDQCRDNLFWSESGMVAAFGLSDLALIRTDDVTLVFPRSQMDHLKDFLKKVGKDFPQLLESHATVSRPWGSYTVFDEGQGYKIKCIHVKPKASLSLQMHHHRSEHWVVVAGSALIQNEEKQSRIHRGESTYIPQGRKHRITNPGDEPLQIIEVQIGDYVGEDDIVRFEDVYGR